MKISKVIAISVWVYSIGSIAISPFFPLQAPAKFPPFGGGNLFLFLVPIIFFGGFALVTPGYPFDAPRLRAKIDDKFGVGTYAGFMAELKPLLLFGVTGIGSSVVQCYMTYRSATNQSYFSACFMASAGISFLLMRIILAKRGVSLESPKIASPWRGIDFVPESIKRIHATNTTAILTGIWTAVGMMGTERILGMYKPDVQTQNMFFLGSAVFFFFIPVPLFVFGIQNQLKTAEGEAFRDIVRRRFFAPGARLFFWLFGAVIASIAVSTIERLF